MKYLLDTHALLWFLEDDPQLPEKVRKEIVSIDGYIILFKDKRPFQIQRQERMQKN